MDTPTKVTLTVDRELLAKELAACARVSQRSSTIPILNTTLLVAAKDSLSITNTDLELAAISRIECDSAETVYACVDSERLLKYANGASSATILMEFDERAITLRSGSSSRAKIAIVESLTFPAVQKPNGGGVYNISSSDLNTLLSRVTYCIGRREAQYSVHSCLIERDAAGWSAAAVDGYRVATTKIGGGGSKSVKVLFPLKLCIEAQKAFSEEEPLTVTVDENHIHIDGKTRTMIATRQAERFPDISRHIKKDPETEATCERLLLKRALSVACGFAKRDPNGLIVTLSIEADRLIVSAKAGAYGAVDGEYEELVAAKQSGPSLSMDFTAAALLDALGAITSDEIRILAWGRLDPIHIIPVDETTQLHLIQPRNLGGGR